jgi:hypothetical protein
MNKNVYSSPLHRCQKWETTEMSINAQKDKQNTKYTCSGILFNCAKE